jgi:hypothetical protein
MGKHDYPKEIKPTVSQEFCWLASPNSGVAITVTQTESMLAWVDRCARRIDFQQLPESRRRLKNRVVIQFLDDSGCLQTCGGATIFQAVSRARLRSATGATGKIGVGPSPEIPADIRPRGPSS